MILLRRSKVEAFFDSNVLLYHLADTKKEATELISRVENREIKGFINDVVVSEVVYGYIRAVTNLPPTKLKKKIVQIEMDFKLIGELLGLFEMLPLRTGAGVIEFITNYKLLPNDALIASICRHYGIKKIATFDEDFKRVDFLEIIGA